MAEYITKHGPTENSKPFSFQFLLFSYRREGLFASAVAEVFDEKMGIAAAIIK